jgi:adenine-specific DNA methylase
MKTALTEFIELLKLYEVQLPEKVKEQSILLLEKEKEQIIDAGNKCQIYNDGFVYEDGEEYYNQTYNQNK